MKIPVIETSKFVFYLEDDAGLTFIHCDVLCKWTREVKRLLLESFNKLVSKRKQPLFAIHSKYDLKHEKFLRMLNFNYLISIKGLDSNDYDIYVWR